MFLWKKKVHEYVFIWTDFEVFLFFCFFPCFKTFVGWYVCCRHKMSSFFGGFFFLRKAYPKFYIYIIKQFIDPRTSRYWFLFALWVISLLRICVAKWFSTRARCVSTSVSVKIFELRCSYVPTWVSISGSAIQSLALNGSFGDKCSIIILNRQMIS